MTPFELVEPRSLGEAIGLLEAADPSVRPIAGGTALLLMMKASLFRPRRLVSLRRLAGSCSGIETMPDGALRVGGMATLGALERTAFVQEGWPVIARTLRILANVRVRNVATVGGSLAHADPHMDLPPLLSALEACVVIAGPNGERTMPIEELSTGYMETVLGGNELITALLVPALGKRRAAYLKCTTRSADDWPALGMAAVLDMDGEAIHDARIVLGAATDKPTRLGEAEAVLRGGAASDANLRRAGEAAADTLTLIGDARGSAAYKKQLARVYVARTVRAAVSGRGAA